MADAAHTLMVGRTSFTHRRALLCADRLIALHAGRLVADGPAAATVTPDLLRLIYGIDVVVAPVPGLAAPVCVPVVD